MLRPQVDLAPVSGSEEERMHVDDRIVEHVGEALAGKVAPQSLRRGEVRQERNVLRVRVDDRSARVRERVRQSVAAQRRVLERADVLARAVEVLGRAAVDRAFVAGGIRDELEVGDREQELRPLDSIVPIEHLPARRPAHDPQTTSGAQEAIAVGDGAERCARRRSISLVQLGETVREL